MESKNFAIKTNFNKTHRKHKIFSFALHTGIGSVDFLPLSVPPTFYEFKWFLFPNVSILI